MKAEIEWCRFSKPAIGDGWELLVSGKYIGSVFVDGEVYASSISFNGKFGSQPLAAQALLRAAWVET